MKTIHYGVLCAAALATGAAMAQVEDDAPQKLADYTCWQLLTEPEESQGSTEVFYLGFALGRAGAELADEAAYKKAIADVLTRCRGEPDTRVLDAFATAIGQG
jgi:hypothetical protein